MGSHTWKKDMTLAAQDVPEVLRALADALEGRAPARAPDRWPNRSPALPEGAVAPRPSPLHPDVHIDLDFMAGLTGLAGGDVRKLVLVAELRGAKSTLKLKAKRGHEVLVKSRETETTSEPQPEPQPEPVLATKPEPVRFSLPQNALRQASMTKPGRDAGHDPSQLAARKEKYRQLKKGMQADFKALERAAQEGVLPPAEVVESFVSRAEIMAESPVPGGDGGAELARANAQFLTDAQALREAARKRDPAALGEVLGRLARRKTACHAQFK